MIFNKSSLLAFFLLAVILVSLTLVQGFFSLLQIQKVSDLSTGIEHRVRAADTLADLRVQLSDLHSFELQALLAPDAAYQERCRKQADRLLQFMNETLAERDEGKTVREEEKAEWQEFKSFWQDYAKIHADPQSLPGESPIDQAMVLSHQIERLREIMDKQVYMNAQFIEMEYAQGTQAANTSRLVIASVTAVCAFLVTVLLAVLFVFKLR